MPSFADLPPFPDDVPTHPLLVVDYELIKSRDQAEIDKLWKAATELGFWYLKNHGVDEEVNQMFEMGAETMNLPLEEKMKYEQGDSGSSFGYKAAGANATDENGTLDTVEFINVAKDDALAWPNKVHRDYPPTVNARMDSTIKPFVQKSLAVNYTLLEVLGERLGLPKGLLEKQHPMDEPSGSEARCIKNPPRPGGISEEKAAIGAHTDFGSLSFLHNRLGGLQVLVPGTSQWQYIKPIPGHAVCNLGDAMAIFSGGILRSNLHRVVPPPKEQGNYERWSLVFFTRPGNSVMLRPLVEESPLIAEAVSKQPPGKYETGQTSKDWFARRIKYQRIKNRTGPETWRASRGTEHQPSAY
ncbi:Clavaminate synthase-like protein [Trametes coccinea BRFM310]|uniref:Clavaminate synthase-like protein n=1 Tax=Trametes coccinea (strain BRFM310) TaxID=1353009 RepID=A0A1Y2IL80_TRAC3|nr:Clavaminate synthase-like protein [Trametes coccinea BRFM310]